MVIGLVLMLFMMMPHTVAADIISFDTNSWDHGSGSQTGWNDGELTGTTSFGTTTLTITSQVFGTATATADHMGRINQSYFTGFAFQMDPSTTNNSGSLSNYLRLDFEFTDAIYLDSFTLTDVDRANNSWYDVVAAEGFVNGIGAVGTGVSANYSFASPTNEEEVTLFGLDAVRPRSSTGNVQNTPPADVTFDFTPSVTAFSIYYWNNTTADDNSTTQTIGIRGNQFEVTKATPEAGSVAMCLVALTMMLISWRVTARKQDVTDRITVGTATALA